MVTLQLTEIEIETICQALSQAGLENDELYKRLMSKIISTIVQLSNVWIQHTRIDPVHARVKITHCENKLRLVKAIMEATHMGLKSAKDIADNTVDGGILLLNESSISKEQWEQIAQSQSLNIKWTYV